MAAFFVYVVWGQGSGRPQISAKRAAGAWPLGGWAVPPRRQSGIFSVGNGAQTPASIALMLAVVE